MHHAIQLLASATRLLSKLQQHQRHRPFGRMAQGLKPSSALMSQVVPLVLQIQKTFVRHGQSAPQRNSASFETTLLMKGSASSKRRKAMSALVTCKWSLRKLTVAKQFDCRLCLLVWSGQRLSCVSASSALFQQGISNLSATFQQRFSQCFSMRFLLPSPKALFKCHSPKVVVFLCAPF
jgi:hypothetical protein